MSKVTVDESLRSKLNGFDEQVEFCDESGAVVGMFLPMGLYLKLMDPQDGCPYSAEELQQSLQDGTPGRTLAEIWKDLGQS